MSKPTEPGYYWWKPYPAAVWEPIKVTENSAHDLIVHWLHSTHWSFMISENGVWGPKIIPPEHGCEFKVKT